MIKLLPCDLPMVPLAAENVQGFLVTTGKMVPTVPLVDLQILPLGKPRT